MAGSPSLPRGMSFWHPVCLIATWFGSGLLPAAPGSWGSLAALPLAWLVLIYYGPYALAAVGGGLFLLGLATVGTFARLTSSHDPQTVVIDEVAAQCLVLTAAPPHPGYLAAGFLVFRVADIVKPWPANWADRALRGAPAIMLDDIFAGVYAWLVLHGLHRLMAGP